MNLNPLKPEMHQIFKNSIPASWKTNCPCCKHKPISAVREIINVHSAANDTKPMNIHCGQMQSLEMKKQVVYVNYYCALKA
jgi:hypothetical protein